MLVENQSILLQIPKGWRGRHFPKFGDQKEIVELPFRRKFSLSSVSIPVKQMFVKSSLLNPIYDRRGDQLTLNITKVLISCRQKMLSYR